MQVGTCENPLFTCRSMKIFSTGTTIAVDIYVWLHKGAFRCLTLFFCLESILCTQLRRGPSAGQTNRRICEIRYEVNLTSRISLKSERKFHVILIGEVHCICRWCDMLLHHKIKPILVFDGRNLPSKAVTEKKRRVKRLA